MGGAGVDYELAADVVARMLDTAEQVRGEVNAGRVGALSGLLADAGLLTRLMVGQGPGHLEELAGRLWMVAR